MQLLQLLFKFLKSFELNLIAQIDKVWNIAKIQGPISYFSPHQVLYGLHDGVACFCADVVELHVFFPVISYLPLLNLDILQVNFGSH